MSDEATTPAKLDPETLSIRAKPRTAIKFKRSVIVGATAAGSLGLVGVAWFALKPLALTHVVDQQEMAQPSNHAPETLSGLPSSYGDVPRLGAPLPGDLGRPILDRQAALAGDTGAVGAQRAEQAAATERERKLAELKAARESAVLFQSRQTTAGSAEPAGAVVATVAASGEPTAVPDNGGKKLSLDPATDPNAQGRKAEFVGRLDPHDDVNPHRLIPAASPYILSAGSIISASLITGLRSDLPGLVTAQVTENVYDSPTGRVLLIPQGSRLVGTYDSVVAFGQKRALVVWQRIILPDASSVRIDNVPATDASGYAGLQDKIDFHTFALLKGVVLSTLLGVSSELAFTGNSDLVQAIRRSTQDNVARAGDQITQRNLNVQPTITVRPGAAVRLVVHKDLILAPWHEGDPNG